MVSALAITDFQRISELRTRCRRRKHQSLPDTTLIDAASFRGISRDASHLLRIARRTYDRLAALRFELDELELLVGRPRHQTAQPEDARWQEARGYLDRLPYAVTPGQTGHCELDRSRLFEAGLDFLIADLHKRAREADDEDRQITWQAFALSLEGLQIAILNAASAARQAIEQASGQRQNELARIADACERIAHHPPASFFDALQLTWLVDFSVSYANNAWLVSPGHLDRTLYPFFQADQAAGLLTSSEALLWLESYYILINEIVPDGLAVAVMVGGVDEAGNDLTNELSHLCLEALRRTNLVYPTVGVCWNTGTPASLVDLTIGLIADGYATPAFFNDATIQRGLRQYGVPAAESWNYINSTCVEITPVGASNVWVASPYFPVCQYMLDEITAQAESPSAGMDFEAFIENYLRRLARAISAGVEAENRSRLIRDEYGGKPLQSVFTRDCVSRGEDIDRGGARYNWIECSFVGLANLVDSLLVIKGEIFEHRRLSFKDMRAILAADFKGEEMARRRFVNGYPKYGHNQGDAEALLNRIILAIQAECKRHLVHPRGAHFVPGAFCWVMHEILGRDCGATPDGRRAGTPFADGCGPAQGRESFGPTAAILSTTSWDASPLVGGAAYNMKFSKPLLADQTGREGLRNLVLTFLRRGGFEVQVNVVDADAMRKAREFPEQYQDLVVRIGGYTDYFVRLSPRMQEELISRTEYASF